MANNIFLTHSIHIQLRRELKYKNNNFNMQFLT